MPALDISHLTIPNEFSEITDFYLPAENGVWGIFYPGPQSIQENPGLIDIVEFMTEKARETQKIDFSIELLHEGKRIIFRGHKITSVEGDIYALRRLPSFVPDIINLGVPRNIVSLLTSDKMNSGGLVVVCGETGQGKTTTTAATIAHRLKHFGSFCLTIEDPVEMPLQGFYDNGKGQVGICFQTNVEEEKLMDAIKGVMRSYPSVSNSILYVGEIRTPEMALETLKIAANGHLVFSTFHSSDLISGLKRYLNLCLSVPGANKDEVKSLFASVFRLMLHQKLLNTTGGKKKADINLLFSPSSTSQVANRLKSGNIDTLSTDIQSQQMLLVKGADLAKEVI